MGCAVMCNLINTHEISHLIFCVHIENRVVIPYIKHYISIVCMALFLRMRTGRAIHTGGGGGGGFLDILRQTRRSFPLIDSLTNNISSANER